MLPDTSQPSGQGLLFGESKASDSVLEPHVDFVKSYSTSLFLYSRYSYSTSHFIFHSPDIAPQITHAKFT